MNNVKYAVCVLIPREGKYLSISRRNDPTKWGIIGGKVDEGETFTEAIVRETREETGLNLDPNYLTPVFQQLCEGDVFYNVTTFLYEQQGPTLDKMTPEEGMHLDYKDESLLLDVVQCPFANYNKGLFENIA